MTDSELPGDPPAVVAALWGRLSDEERQALLPHLKGGTSAEWLAQTLRAHGHKIGPTSLKTYLRSIKECAS